MGDGRSAARFADCPVCGRRVRVTLDGCLRTHCPNSSAGVVSSLSSAPVGDQVCEGSKRSLAWLRVREAIDGQ